MHFRYGRTIEISEYISSTFASVNVYLLVIISNDKEVTNILIINLIILNLKNRSIVMHIWDNMNRCSFRYQQKNKFYEKLSSMWLYSVHSMKMTKIMCIKHKAYVVWNSKIMKISNVTDERICRYLLRK